MATGYICHSQKVREGARTGRASLFLGSKLPRNPADPSVAGFPRPRGLGSPAKEGFPGPPKVSRGSLDPKNKD